MIMFPAGSVRPGRKRQHGGTKDVFRNVGLLKRLCEAPGPAGQEQKVKEIIVHEIKSCCTGLREDPLGNLIARVGPKDGYRIGILAHMDEVGLIVSRISDNGLLGFELVWG